MPGIDRHVPLALYFYDQIRCEQGATPQAIKHAVFMGMSLTAPVAAMLPALGWLGE